MSPVLPTHRVLEALPKGSTLPADVWLSRHTWLSRLLWAHVPAVYAFALATGATAGHSAMEALAVALVAGLASGTTSRSRRSSSLLVAFGLLTCSAVVVHLAQGYVEAHFHFFVVVTLLVLYEEWRLFLLAITYVLVHHGLGGALMPASVFNHPNAVAAPWTWAAIHAAFIAALSVGSIVFWRLNEDGRAAAREAHGETEQALESARLSGEQFRNAFALAPIGMALVGLDGRWLKVNSALCRLTGYSEAELLERTSESLTHPEDLEQDRRDVAEILHGENTSYESEKRYLTASGRTIWVQLAVSVVRDKVGRPLHFVSQISDVTESRSAAEKLQHLADHDPLTGLRNRRRFEGELEAELQRAKRYGHGAALLVVDLDRFKSINDSYGHRAGDEALRHTARALVGRVRSTDVVGRLGGDEFAILMPHLPATEMTEVARSVVDAIERTPVVVAGAEVRVRASVGVTALPLGPDDTLDEAMSRADADMYAAKADARLPPAATGAQ